MRATVSEHGGEQPGVGREHPTEPPPSNEEKGAATDRGPRPGASGPEQGPGSEVRMEEDLDALLADTQRERDQYLELAQRTKADFENYRKRMVAEVQAAALRGKAELARGLIGVTDNLERALQASAIDPAGEEMPSEPLGTGHLADLQGIEGGPGASRGAVL